MKIAFVRTASNILRYGGYNIQEIGLAKALLPYGISTDVYARFSNIEDSVVVAKDNAGNRVKVIPLKGTQIYKEIMYYPTLKKDLLSGNYDMVQLLDDSQMMLPALFKALKSAGVKTILWQGMYRDFEGKAAHLMQKVYDAFCAGTLDKYSDLKIAKTETAKQYLLKKNYKNILVLPVGLDEVKYEVDEVFESKILNFKKEHPKLLLYIGAIEPRRNPDFLIRLLELKCKQDPNVGLVMIGKGVSRNVTMKVIKERGMEKHILMLESVPNKNLSSVFENADIFLLPTNYEIYGMVVMEALLFGLPVLATPEAGPKYLLPNRQLGMCEALDLQKWSEAIDYYFSHPSTESDRKMRCDYVNQNFRWDIIASDYYKIIKKLINED